MSDIAIKVENLGKSYLVGHESAKKERYTLLRDVLARNVKSFTRKTKDMFSGKPIVQGDEVEEFWALRDINIEIKQGESVGIIGRNGAGKSTLLKVLSRITEPTKGRVSINGRVASLLEVGTGFHPELTGRENIFLNGAILGMSRREIQTKFDEIVAFAEVERFLDTPVKRYSSGMYVRLAFAVAAHLEPEILVVDEVLAVGDINFQKKCLGKMGSVAKEGRTVLFVSHNIAAIKALCPSSCLLEHGRIQFKGKTDDAIELYLDASVAAINEIGLARRPDRVGGNKLRLQQISLTDESGSECGFAACGSRVVLTLKFFCNEIKLKNLRFGVTIVDKNSERYLTDLNSYYGSTDQYQCGEGEYEFRFEVQKMMLAPGAYSMHVIVTSGLEVLDWIKDAGRLVVTDGQFYESGQMPQPGNNPIFFCDFSCSLNALSHTNL